MHGCLQRGRWHEGEFRVCSCPEPVALSVTEQFPYEERICDRFNSLPSSAGGGKRLNEADRGLFLDFQKQQELLWLCVLLLFWKSAAGSAAALGTSSAVSC